MSIRINNKIISGTYTSQSYRYVGEIFQSTLPINDSRVALLDGHKIYESEGYGSFIQYITSLALLYPQLACTEDEWQLSNTTYGECGKFVISEDGVRLPKIVSFVQGLSSLQDLATLVEAGLPNITGAFSGITNATRFNNFSGATYGQGTATADVGTGSTTGSPNVLFDASLSNPTYGNSTTVQPQSIRYPYYIVLATGVTQEVKVKEELMTNNPFTLFESKYSEVELNNTSWLLSNGQWNSKELYPSAYNELLKEYNTDSNKYSIKLHTEEYGDYDFVLNLDDETFRLPLLDGSESVLSNNYDELTLHASGTLYTAPANGWYSVHTKSASANQYINILNQTNFFESLKWSTAITDMVCWMPCKKGDVVKVNYTTSGGFVNFRFFYAQGNGSLYFYVGETNINTNLVDTGKLTQEVANLIPNNSSLIAGYGMPSNRYIDLTLGATDSTYTAPANGWYLLQKQSSGSGQSVIIDNKVTGFKNESTISTTANQRFTVSALVKKGETVSISFSSTGATNLFRFYYAEGEK